VRRALVLVLALAGCGDPLVGGAFAPPYFTFTAIASAPMGVTLPKNINIALLWYSDNGDGQSYATEVVTFSGEHFPIEWLLDVHALPPMSSIHGIVPIDNLDPTMRFADGTLVAYADNNGNGKLDIDPTDGTRSPDVVLAAATQLDFFYLAAGRPAPPPFVGIVPVAPAFSLVSEPPRVDPDIGECDEFNANGHLSSLCEQVANGTPSSIPLPATIDFPVTADPSLRRYACASFWGPNEYPDWLLAQPSEIGDGPQYKFCRGYNCPLDVPPPGVTVECNAAGTAYRYKNCSNDATRCGTTFCHYGHGARLPGSAIPAGWPCPAP
jgi:hypothetical protein